MKDVAELRLRSVLRRMEKGYSGRGGGRSRRGGARNKCGLGARPYGPRPEGGC